MTARDPNGQVMKVRNIRFTDEQWADVRLIGLDCLRHIISIEATYARKFRERQKDWATALIDRDGIVGAKKRES